MRANLGPRLARSATVAVAGALALALTAPAAAAYEAGVDVSRYQHATSLDWAKVKGSGVDFAFIKATEGRTYTNAYFAADWAATTKLGIYRGAYHFARPSKGTAAAQAKYFVGVAGLARGVGDLPPVLDLEVTGGLGVADLRTWTSNFLKTVESLTGRTPIIYCSPSFWSSHLGNSTSFTRYPLWIAHYTTAAQPWVPGGWPTWTFWQNTSSGRVNGISGNVDQDRFNGTLADLQRLAQVPPARVSTTTTSQADRTGAYLGQTVQLSTTVRTTAGAPVVGGTVALARRLPGTTDWTRVTTGVTDTDGQVSLSAVFDQEASYRTRFLGNTGYAPSMAPPIAVARVAAPTRTILLADRTGAYLGQSVLLSTTVVTAAGGAPVVGGTVALARRLSGTTTWTRVSTGVTDGNGELSLGVVVDRSASYRTRLLGNGDYAGSAAQPLQVSLVPAPTATTLRADRAAVYPGQSVHFTGTVTADTGSGSTPVAGRRVALDRRLPGTTSWSRVAAGVTDATGRVVLAARADYAAAYRARLLGDSAYASSSAAPVTVTVLPKAATTLTIEKSAARVRRGAPVRLSGHLTEAGGKALAGRSVTLYRRVMGTSHWYRVGASTSAAPSGWWQVVARPTRGWAFKAVYSGDSQHHGARSGIVRVRIR